MAHGKINLGDYTAGGNRYFNTRPRGVDISREVRFEDLTRRYQTITLQFPADLSGINTNFLEEFLEEAVLSLGENKQFKDVFKIENHSLYNVEALVDQAVQSLEQKKMQLQVSFD